MGAERRDTRRPATTLIVAAAIALAACGGDGGGRAAADRAAGSTSSTPVPLATPSLPDAPQRGRLSSDDLAELSGNAAAVTAAADGLGLTRPPGDRNRRPPVKGVGETAIAVRDAHGKLVGCCVMTAVTEPQRERGLMQVKDFGGYAGMLFVWTADTGSGFWMRNTPTPLSIAWFDADGNFVSRADMAPCADVDTCPSYDPTGPYRFALEVPGGDLAKLGIGPGSTLAVGGPCARRR